MFLLPRKQWQQRFFSTAKHLFFPRGNTTTSTSDPILTQRVLNTTLHDPHVLLQERDRLLVEKTSAREAVAEAKRSKMLEAADRARLARERSGQEREKEIEREAAVKRARQAEATRCEVAPIEIAITKFCRNSHVHQSA